MVQCLPMFPGHIPFYFASQTSSCQHLRAFFSGPEPLCLLMGQVRNAGELPPPSSSQPVTVGCWWINTPAPLPLGWKYTSESVLHGFPIWQKDSALVVHRGNKLENFLCVIFFPSFSHFSTSLLMFPGVTFQINQLFSNPCLRVFF